jgi:hypothetical protein
MAVKTATVPAAGVRNLSANAGVSIAAAEADVVLAAGDSISYQNNGDCVLKLQVTTSCTGTVQALSAPNNVALTLTSGQTLLLGPYDPAVFGQMVSITTATAVGTAALYWLTPRYPNGLRNPFETNPAAVDAM